MTRAADSAVEDAFEAILAGRPAPEGQAGLAAFTEAVRSSATRPGRPDAALAELLATGLLTDQSSPSVRTARSAGSPPARRPSRVRTRRRTAMILPALIAKFLSAGAVAQAATGAGVVLVAVTGVGAVGALPAPAQDAFSTVVAAVTPLDATTAEETDEETDETSGETDLDTVPVLVAPEDTEAERAEAEKFDAVAWEAAGPAEGQPFGAWVSLAAHNKDALEAQGLSFSATVRKWAQQKGFDDADLVKEGVNVDDLTEAPAEADSDSDTGKVTERAEVAKTTKVAKTTEDRGPQTGAAPKGSATSKAGATTEAGGAGNAGGASGNGNAGGGNGRGNA